MLNIIDPSFHQPLFDFCQRLRVVYRDTITVHRHPSGYILVEYISRIIASYTSVCTEIIDPRTDELNIPEGFLINISHEQTTPEQLQNFLNQARETISALVEEWIKTNPFTK